MMAPKFEEMWMVVIKEGGTVEAALDATDGTINSKTNPPVCSRCTLV